MFDQEGKQRELGELLALESEPGRDKEEFTSTVDCLAPINVRIQAFGTYMKCTKCGKIKPASQVGFLAPKRDRKGKVDLITVRNQPQCKTCR